MGDDGIYTVISHIDMGYLVTLITSGQLSCPPYHVASSCDHVCSGHLVVAAHAAHVQRPSAAGGDLVGRGGVRAVVPQDGVFSYS